MKKKILILTSLFFLISCSEINFVLKENNPDNILKDKTLIVFNGNSGDGFTQEMLSFFGESEKNEFILHTKFSEKNQNRVVKKNQVAEEIDYELIVNYELFYKAKGCKVFNKTVATKFSLVPKSFGYNFATDRSFEKLYISSIRKNIRNFIYSIPKDNQFICL